MKTKWVRILGIVVAAVILAAVLAASAAMVVLHIRTTALQDDYLFLYENEKYRTPVRIDGVQVIEQDVSCGYAVIEMFSSCNGNGITEQSLYDEYGRVVTSTGKAFCAEMNKQFPEFSTTMHSYLKDSELIVQIYENLEEGIPVPIEWVALYDGEWTLHYSLVTGIDIPGDKVTVANPYGYVEEIGLSEFLDRTSFEAYRNMPLFLRLGFAFGIFEKNTVFSVRRI